MALLFLRGLFETPPARAVPPAGGWGGINGSSVSVSWNFSASNFPPAGFQDVAASPGEFVAGGLVYLSPEVDREHTTYLHK